MKNTSTTFFIFVLSVLIFTSCKPGEKNDGIAAPVDKQRLSEASLQQCPAGQKFKIIPNDVRLYIDNFPYPRLFAIKKGFSRCAPVTAGNHGGIDTWLRVDTTTDCILNGSLWTTDSFYLIDSVKIFYDLRPLDPLDTNRIKIYTNYGYRLSSLNQNMGLVTYTCQPE